jgi:hypothetical protein
VRIRSAEILTHPYVSAGVVLDGSSGPLDDRLALLERVLGVTLVASRASLRYDR